MQWTSTVCGIFSKNSVAGEGGGGKSTTEMEVGKEVQAKFKAELQRLDLGISFNSFSKAI